LSGARDEAMASRAIGVMWARRSGDSAFRLSDVSLCQRVIYVESAAQGLSLIEAEPNSDLSSS
jgi:Lon protease-like protein